MLLSLLAITAALFLITSSNALSVDTSHHLARHQLIAARHPALKRASISARCKKRNTTSVAAAPSTTSTTPHASSPSQAPPASSPVSGKGKVGIAWSYGDDPRLKNFITEKVSAIYSWTPDKPQNTDGLQYAPMLWGTSQLDAFEKLVQPGYANVVLGFNEPDIPGQSDLDPVTAAQIWQAHGQPLRAQGYSTITPAVAFSKPWMNSFLGACGGCKFDHMAAHSYATSAQETIDYLTDLHNTYGMSIWVTEFACQNFQGGAQCNEGQVFAFMTKLIQWMDATPWIDKYFYYGVMTAQLININPLNALMNQDGTPTALGRLYIGS